jgi:biotin carboxyl carrier protein
VIRHPRLETLVTSSGSGNGEILIQAPAVGMYGFAPRVGEVLVGGSCAGRLCALGQAVELVLPVGVTGRVAERRLPARSTAVEYGQVLLRLVPVEASEVGAGIVSRADAATRGLPEGTFAITSPTNGMFYRRARPDSPSYVEVGQVVEEGTTLALVEVMKCFSAITYGGEGLPARAEILEIRVADSSEVTADQILFVVGARQ